MTTSVFFSSVWQSEGVLTKLGENLRLSPSKNGKQNMDVLYSTHGCMSVNDTIKQFLSL